jgi:hypothetical protein
MKLLTSLDRAPVAQGKFGVITKKKFVPIRKKNSSTQREMVEGDSASKLHAETRPLKADDRQTI